MRIEKEAEYIARIILGGILIILGVAGFFLPVIPGFIFFFYGLALIFGKHLIEFFRKLFS